MNVNFASSSAALPIACFLGFIAVLLFMSMLSSPDLRADADGLYTQGDLGLLRGGLALTGDSFSAAGVLYLCGVVAVGSQDGVLLLAATALSPLLLKVWLAERLPGGGGWSLGDVLARKLPAGTARRAACLAALLVTVPLLVAQLVPIGQITAALVGLPGQSGEIAGIVLVGVLLVVCAAIGGVRGSTRFQLVKTVAFLAVAPVCAILILAHYDWSYAQVVTAAAHGSGAGSQYLSPGQLFGGGTDGRLDTLSLAVTILAGSAFLPHMITRVSTAYDARSARRISSYAVGAICLLCVSAVVIGYGTMALVGAHSLAVAGPRGNNLLLLASALNGHHQQTGMALTLVCCAAFLTALASASVLLLNGSAALVHDLMRSTRKELARQAEAGQQGIPRSHGGFWSRFALVAVGAVALWAAVAGRTANAQLWLTFSYTEAASVVLPALAYALLWRRFSARGLRFVVYGGSLLVVVLLALTPMVSGTPQALFPHADWHLLQLHAPGIYTLPAGFLLGWLGNLGSTPATDTPLAAQDREPVPA